MMEPQSSYLFMPRKKGEKPIAVHIFRAQKALGKPLPYGAVVHHANGKTRDNRNKNLVICPSNAYHRLLHQRLRAFQACGDPHFRLCQRCRKWDHPSAFIQVKSGGLRHPSCQYPRPWQYKNHPLLTTREAAELLNVPLRIIHRLMKNNFLNGQKMFGEHSRFRITRASVLAYLQQAKKQSES